MAVTVTNKWVLGARPRTLPASAMPVVVGTAVADVSGGVIWWRAAAALVVAVSIQVATNYANDYSDGVRGTDQARVGPARLVASGAAAPRSVKRAAFGAFGVAGVAGVALAAAAGWWIIALGALCMAAGWFYTGGPRPYGYAGYGELFVFVFFGLVATGGTVYVQTATWPGLAVLAGVPVGMLATAMLVVNNLRDLEGDRRSGKQTLAVRMGEGATRRFFAGCLAVAFAAVVVIAVFRPWALLALGAVPLAARASRRVLRGEDSEGLIEVLGETGKAQLAMGLLLAAGILL